MRFIAIIFLFFISRSVFCQISDGVLVEKKDTVKKVNILSAHKIEVKQDLFDGNQLFTGQVKFEHDGSFLECDSAVYYKEGDYFHAFSNARLYNDTLRLSAHSLDYSGDTRIAKAIKNARLVDKGKIIIADTMDYNRNTQIAEAISNVVFTEETQRLTTKKLVYNALTKKLDATGKVVFSDPKQKLETEQLSYNERTKLATYNTGATITSNDGSVVKSRSGVYNVTTKRNTLKRNVYMENDKYTIDSESLDYFPDEERVILSGYSVITDKIHPQRYIETTKGIYYNVQKEAFLEKRSAVHYDGKILRGDKMYWDQKLGFGNAKGNVVLEDPVEERKISGDYGEAFQNIDSAFVTGKRVIAAKNFKGDSLFLHADTLMVVRAKNKKGLIRAFKNARIYKLDLQGKCDSISFDEGNGLMTLFRDPVLWFSGSQITGDTIKAFHTVKENRLDSIHVFENSFAISKVDSLRDIGFNQVKSKYLNAYILNKELRFVRAKINAQSLSFVEDENKDTGIKILLGINKSDCGIIETEIKKRQVELVSCLIGAKSKLFPPSQLPEKERRLFGFDWKEDERLKKKEDLFLEEPVIEENEIDSS